MPNFGEMTPQHVIYIPTMLLLGLVVGYILGARAVRFEHRRAGAGRHRRARPGSLRGRRGDRKVVREDDVDRRVEARRFGLRDRKTGRKKTSGRQNRLTGSVIRERFRAARFALFSLDGPASGPKPRASFVGAGGRQERSALVITS